MTTLSHTPTLSHKSEAGFTLVELMIVVAIVGILAAIAYPSYIDSVRKGRRAEGRAAIANLLQQQERFFTQNNRYQDFASNAVPATFKGYSGENGPVAANYLLAAVACQPIGGVVPTFRDCIDVVATPQAGVFTDPDVTMLATNSMGVRRCTGANQSRCWK